MELLGPVPVGRLAVSARSLRPGRTVQLAAAELYDVARDRPVATARAWLFPASGGRPGPGAGCPRPRPRGRRRAARPAGLGRRLPRRGRLALDHRAVLADPGPGVVWMRPPDLVAGEPISPLQRLLACADSASGVELGARPAGVGRSSTPS